jgi:transcriptional regulator with XRE-family HTH domain
MSHLGPYLAAFLGRKGLTQRRAAQAAGVSTVSFGERLRGRVASVSTAKVILAASAHGATTEELESIEVLDALDRGALPLPPGTSEEAVRAARCALLGVRKSSSLHDDSVLLRRVPLTPPEAEALSRVLAALGVRTRASIHTDTDAAAAEPAGDCS